MTTVAELNDKRTEYISAVWEVDPAFSTASPRRGAIATATQTGELPEILGVASAP
ncbi:MAG: hypothetical protein ACRDTS_09765 [Mycobacterium sp.]